MAIGNFLNTKFSAFGFAKVIAGGSSFWKSLLSILCKGYNCYSFTPLSTPTMKVACGS